MSAPLVHHSTLMPDFPTEWFCAICARPEVPGEAIPCERCWTLMHWDCYWTRATSPAERAAQAAAIAEVNAEPTEPVEVRADGRVFRFPVRLRSCPADDYFDRLIILCPGCRS